MLLVLHEQDKMAPGRSQPEVNSNNIRFTSEAILVLIWAGFSPTSALQVFSILLYYSESFLFAKQFN
uniref:Uncharacterized protein n=1 Tax=Castor canadensis TaxID=51338 RepID=A0A8C0WXC0_CASCN